MFSKLTSFGLSGLDGCTVTVESDTFSGLPAFEIVGLPDASVSESRERVRLAIKNSGYSFPVSRVTVNLAPADMKKTGSVYDLPVLLSILVSSGQLRFDAAGRAFLGELSLDGSLRPVSGVLPMAIAAARCGIRELFVPLGNAPEAAIARGITVYGAASVAALAGHLTGKAPLEPCRAPEFHPGDAVFDCDFSDVRGQAAARRAMEIAAAGGHNILMIGPPGSGKSMLAKRLPTIMPPLTYEECIEVTKIYSVAGSLDNESPYVTARPFRAPHHTVSEAGLTGGGTNPRPGEISKAHCGVLFLDELPEFPRHALDLLRQPIEDGKITISRSSGAVTYPCELLLAAAMNPCPCGNYGSARPCVCTPYAIEKYLGKISGPLLDRIDLHVEVGAVDYDSLTSGPRPESSAAIRERVIAARAIQTQRYGEALTNARLGSAQLVQYCALSSDAQDLLRRAFRELGLTARAHDKVLRVARTIADLDGQETITRAHIAEAVSYRTLDRKYWQR